MNETLRSIIATTSKDSGHGFRAAHAKGHALLQATLNVPGDLPPRLAQGMFAKRAQYKAFMRFSTIPGDILDDKVSVPRGLGLKVAGVEGERLAGSQEDGVQDFLFTKGPAFSNPTAAKCLDTLQLVAKTTDKAEWAKLALSSALRGVESIVGDIPALAAMGGYKPTNPAGDRYFSQPPFRHGDHVAKYLIVPVSTELVGLADEIIDLSGGRDRIREEIVRFFATNGGIWALRAQLPTDLATMPIENASIPWPEEQSPYEIVARIEVEPQTAWSEVRALAIDDGMAFSPWNCLAAHQPMRSINRVRREAYAMSSNLRSKINGCPMHGAVAGLNLEP